jgi:hypothetical protein
LFLFQGWPQQGSGNVDSRRIDELIETLERNKADEVARLQTNREREERDESFQKDWHSAYAIDLNEESIAGRLIELSRHVIDRHWDYYLSESLSRTDLNVNFEMALITLRWACSGDAQEVIRCLKSQRQYIDYVREAHNDLYRVCLGRVSKGLPLTPPLNQQQMGSILGITPGQFRAQFRAEKWRTKDLNNVHARKWWNIDRTVQVDALRAIRVKMQDKIWLNNRVEI